MEVLISFVFAVTLLAISPGPDNVFVLMQSVIYGKKYGLATILGLMTGCIIHTIFLAVGISSIIKDNNNIFLGIKLFGAVYLLYLAYKVYRSSSVISVSTKKIENPRYILLENIDEEDSIELLSDYLRKLVFFETLLAKKKTSDEIEQELFSILSQVDAFLKENCIDGEQLADELRDNLLAEYEG